VTTLVLLHGWGMNPAVFETLQPLLAARHEVLAPALPGYADRASCEPYTLDALAATLSVASPARCAVVGWSLGALIALSWARAMPEQVERLALIAATPSFVKRDGWADAVDERVFEEFTAGLQRDVARTLNRFVTLQARGDSEEKRVVRTLRNALARCGRPRVDVLNAGLRLLRQTDLRSALSRIEQPVMALHGRYDALATCAAGEYIARSVPRGRYEMIDRAGHAPFVSSPDVVSRSLLEFFD